MPQAQITFWNCCLRSKLCYLGDMLKLKPSIACQSKLLWEERDCICVIVGSVFVRLHLRYLCEWGRCIWCVCGNDCIAAA